jgi:hypothetical protein
MKGAGWAALAAGAGLVVFGGVVFWTTRPADEASPRTRTIYDDIDPEVPGMKAAVGRDDIPALWDPQFTTADKAFLDDDEPVIGLAMGKDVKAYPLSLLNSHEIANDTLDGIPVAVTW